MTVHLTPTSDAHRPGYNRPEMNLGPRPALRRVLAIDDDPISLAIAAVLLEAESCEVLQADGGEAALELLLSSPQPDCILADLRMPTLAGPELAQRLRQAAPGALLLAMSATPPPHAQGYDGVLKKPLTPEALRVVLASLAVFAAESPAHTSASDAHGDGMDDAVIDVDVFDRLRRAMSAAGLAEVIQAFVQDASGRIQSMRAADPAAIRRLAHTLKGGASMVGALQVARIASEIEEGVDQDGERTHKLDELEACLQRAESILIDRLKA